MTAASTTRLSLSSTARWLAGPIFDKELRVASRQCKYYLLRFAYVCLLVLVTVQVWFVAVGVGGGASGVVQVSRLGGAGKTIIVTIVVFQFVTGQILAAVLLSDAISSELRQRTLEGLLVTPIGALHILLGKLLSRLTQLVLLLAISLPVLAIIRVFGGVPWDYVIAGLCLTLSGSVFAGSLSLRYSITQRHAYQAVLMVGAWYLVIWGILPWLLMSLTGAGYLSYAAVQYVLSLTNPPLALFVRTQEMLRGPSPATASAPLLWHCLTILAGAALLLVLSVRSVRRLALADRSGALREAKGRRRGGCGVRVRQEYAREPIRRVRGLPVVWKELCASRRQMRGQVLFHILLWGAAGSFIILMAVGFFGPGAHESLFIPIVILHWLFTIRLAVATSSAITREREARTWPILLATPLSDREIVQGKARAALRRNLPVLVPLVLFYALALLLGSGPRFAALLSLATVGGGLAGTVVLLLGLGLYLSTRLKTTAGAVASTLAVYLAPKLFCCGVPLPLFMLAAGSGAPGEDARLAMTALTLVPAAVCALIGVQCLRAATRRLRREVF